MQDCANVLKVCVREYEKKTADGSRKPRLYRNPVTQAVIPPENFCFLNTRMSTGVRKHQRQKASRPKLKASKCLALTVAETKLPDTPAVSELMTSIAETELPDTPVVSGLMTWQKCFLAYQATVKSQYHWRTKEFWRLKYVCIRDLVSLSLQRRKSVSVCIGQL